MTVTRDELITAMAAAIDLAKYHNLSLAQAEDALDAALPLMLACITDHGLAGAFDVMRGRDTRNATLHAALRGMGAAE